MTDNQITLAEMIGTLHKGHKNNIKKINGIYVENIESCICNLECIPYTTKEDWTSYGERVTQVIRDLNKLRDFGIEMSKAI